MSQTPGVVDVAVAVGPVVREVGDRWRRRRPPHRVLRRWIRSCERRVKRDSPHLGAQLVELLLQVGEGGPPGLE